MPATFGVRIGSLESWMFEILHLCGNFVINADTVGGNFVNVMTNDTTNTYSLLVY
jgi:hypothetical protein